MPKFPYLQRSDHNTSAMKHYITRCHLLCGFFSLVSSILVYGSSLLITAVMVYHNYPAKWTFLGYVISTGWIFVMNVMSNVLILGSKKEVRRENQRTSRQTSVNLEMLNNPDNTRYLSRPRPGMFRQATRLSECVNHTPPPSYEDVSKISEVSKDESFSPEGAIPKKISPTNNDKAVYEVLESAQEMKKVSEMLKEEFDQKTGRYSHRRNNQKYSRENLDSWKSERNNQRYSQENLNGQQSERNNERYSQENLDGQQSERNNERYSQEKHGRESERNNQRYSQENQDGRETGRNNQRYSQENQEDRKSGKDLNKGRPVQDLNDDEKAKRILHERIERRRNQLDKRLEGDSLRKMNEYCMRDIKKEAESEKRSPSVVCPSRQPSDVFLTPKESLKRNLRAKYCSSAENFIDIHSSRDSVSSLNLRNFELPRVHHAKSTLSLKLPTRDVTSSGFDSGSSLPEVRGSHPDIRAANDVGLPLERTWKPKMPHGAKANLDTSFSLKHLDERVKRDSNMCSRSRSMPGKRNSKEMEGHF